MTFRAQVSLTGESKCLYLRGFNHSIGTRPSSRRVRGTGPDPGLRPKPGVPRTHATFCQQIRSVSQLQTPRQHGSRNARWYNVAVEVRAMLDVSLNLVAVVAMLFGIVVPGLHIEVDGLNSPTAKPIPGGRHEMGTDGAGFKAPRGTLGRNSSRIFPYCRAMAKAYRSWSRERAGRGASSRSRTLLVRILATLVYDARTFMAGKIAI